MISSRRFPLFAALSLASSLTISGSAWAAAPLPQPEAISHAIGAVRPAVAARVEPFSLSDVRLLDSPFRQAMLRDRDYLLALQPDRFLHNFRTNAGLPAKAPLYGGWESMGVAGQTLGHYLSACSMMYQSTGDPRMKQRVDYIVDELALCQQANGNGYVSAIPDGKAIFADVKAGHGEAVERGWVPWYTTHKVMAGLRDAYLDCGNQKARTVLISLADWTRDTTHGLTDAEFQRMLDTEQGGMDEVLGDVYAMTGDTKYLQLAERFCHRRILDPMSQQHDMLNDFHANTQIPKVIGFERIYQLTGDPEYGTAARFFWKTVVDNRTYVIGGNSDYEHFFDPKDFGKHLSVATCETCNTYNMLRLTRALFTLDPTARKMDYYERALYNHILGSQDPKTGMMTYFVALKPGHFKVYSDPDDSFWCCVGTGIENHAKYGDTIYFHNDRALYVNLFIPSTLNWAEKGIAVRQETRFPERDTTRLTLTAARPQRFALTIRYPSWCHGMTVAVNGKPVPLTATPGSYAAIDRTWHSGDVVDVHLPMHLATEALPGAPTEQAILYGPIVLAGDLGRSGLDTISQHSGNQLDSKFTQVPAPVVPVLISDSADITAHLTPVPGQPLTFQTAGMGRPGDVTLLPFYKAQEVHYNVYWDVYTAARWKAEQAAVAAEQQRQRDRDARTLDEYRPGDQQSDVDHHFQGERSGTGSFQDRGWRDARDGGSLSFDMAVAADQPMRLLLTYWGSDNGNRVFDILVDGQVVGSQTLNNQQPDQFFDVLYPIPEALTRGKKKVTVRLQAKPGAMAGGIFGCRTLR